MEIFPEDEVKCFLLTSSFIEPGNPSLSACTDSDPANMAATQAHGFHLCSVTPKTVDGLVFACALS